MAPASARDDDGAGLDERLVTKKGTVVLGEDSSEPQGTPTLATLVEPPVTRRPVRPFSLGRAATDTVIQ